tara:strand:+ start:22085 stop:22375 length:291 start_codon:yes stop_codon:yes gene_type:complete
LEAFYEQGKWAMLPFYAVTISGIFTVQAEVTLLTASVFSSLFQLTVPLFQISGVLLLICSVILIVGSYRVLDSTMKNSYHTTHFQNIKYLGGGIYF